MTQQLLLVQQSILAQSAEYADWISAEAYDPPPASLLVWFGLVYFMAYQPLSVINTKSLLYI